MPKTYIRNPETGKLVESDSTPVDRTLKISGAAADAKVTGERLEALSSAVKFTAQTLTDEQKEQARENIGVGSAYKAEMVQAVLAALPTWEGGSY